jgi:hypothetical protein
VRRFSDNVFAIVPPSKSALIGEAKAPLNSGKIRIRPKGKYSIRCYLIEFGIVKDKQFH